MTSSTDPSRGTQVLVRGPAPASRQTWGSGALALILLAALGFFSEVWILPRPLADEVLFDLFTRVRTQWSVGDPGPITIVRIDDRSFEEFGVSPLEAIPLHRRVLERLQELGARVIGFDYVTSHIGQHPEGPSLLGFLQDAGNIVVGEARVDPDAPPTPVGRRTEALVESVRLTGGFTNFEVGRPIARLQNRWGIRRTACLTDPEAQGRSWAFSTTLAGLYLGEDEIRQEDDALHLGQRRIPLSGGGMWIPYVRGSGFFSIAYADLIGDRLKEDYLRSIIADRVVLVGSYLQAGRDVHRTPLGPMPGVEIQAAILRGLIGPGPIVRGSPGWKIGLLVVVLAVMSWGWRSASIGAAVTWVIGMTSAVFALELWAFLRGDWVGGLPPLLAPAFLGLIRWGWPRRVPAPVPMPTHQDLRDTVGRLDSGELVDTVEVPRMSGDFTLNVIRLGISDRYTNLEELGRGGMGIVLRGRDRVRERDVALKVLSPMLCDRPELVKRFLREVETLKSLDHPAVIRVYDVEEESSPPFYTMELVDGENLHEIREAGERLDLAVGGVMFAEILAGLDHIHSRSIVHRDLKPENLMRTADGRMKLLDFGLAHLPEASALTQEGHVLGTLRYMSPEQRDGRPLDARSDIFSLGLVIYEQFTGSLPYPLVSHILDFGQGYRSLLESRPEAPEALDTLLAECVRIDPLMRPRTCRELLDRWEAVFGAGGGLSSGV